jgi:hypothetical protein
MVDDIFRSYRNHNTFAREVHLLAELARLTGQGDPYRDRGHDGSFQARADNISTKRHQQGEDQYVALRRRQPSPVPQPKKPPSNKHFSQPPVKFNGVTDHSAAVNKVQYSGGQQTSLDRNERQRVLPRSRAPTFAPASDDRHDGEMQSAEMDETHAYIFYGGILSPRSRRVMVIAVLGLAWLGVASAFSYYAVFGGGAVLPTLPPLMAADNRPKEIVPNYGDARSNHSSQTPMVSAGSSEKFVSRWPADNQEPRKTALISSDPTALLIPSVPASHSPEPKKVHTIIVRSDGSQQTDLSAVAQSATSARAPGTR